MPNSCENYHHQHPHISELANERENSICFRPPSNYMCVPPAYSDMIRQFGLRSAVQLPAIKQLLPRQIACHPDEWCIRFSTGACLCRVDVVSRRLLVNVIWQWRPTKGLQMTTRQSHHFAYSHLIIIECFSIIWNFVRNIILCHISLISRFQENYWNYFVFSSCKHSIKFKHFN